MPALLKSLLFGAFYTAILAVFLMTGLVVMVTGFVFAAIHLNFFSLVWLIPLVFYRSLRRKYETLWYSVIFHFVFNTTSCLYDP